MRQTELHGYAALSPVFAIGREVIATQCARKIVAQHHPQYLRSPRAINPEERKELGAESPGPMRLAISLMPGLIRVQHRLAGQHLLQGLMRLRHGRTDFLDHLGQLAP